MSDVLDLIEDAIADTSWLLGEDAALWRPEPVVDSHGRVPYEVLDPHEQEALHQWCTDHKVDYKNVPIDGLIELDPVAGEWRIEIYRRNREGRFYLDGDDIARAVLRRAHQTDLPWRRPCPE